MIREGTTETVEAVYWGAPLPRSLVETETGEGYKSRMPNEKLKNED